MCFNVVKTFVDCVYYVNKLVACWRKCWILKALSEMLSLREVLKTETDVLANLVQLGLLLK